MNFKEIIDKFKQKFDSSSKLEDSESKIKSYENTIGNYQKEIENLVLGIAGSKKQVANLETKIDTLKSTILKNNILLSSYQRQYPPKEETKTFASKEDRERHERLVSVQNLNRK